MKVDATLLKLLLFIESCWILVRAHWDSNYRISSDSRQRPATALPVVEFWRRHRADGDDSLRTLRWAHDVNSWQRLVQLSDDSQRAERTDVHANETFLVEGDVYLSKKGQPVMLSHGGNKNDVFMSTEPVPFKEWLLAVAGTGKAIKVNIQSDNAVKPTLRYLFALKRNLRAPVIVHGNVLAGPASEETPLNGRRFVSLARSEFGQSTVSVGWTQPLYMDWVLADDMRYDWRDLFDMLDLVYDAANSGPVMVSVSAAMAQHSLSQLVWLLSVRASISLHLWSDVADADRRFDWLQLARLKMAAGPDQILYDLLPAHREKLAEAYEALMKNRALFAIGAPTNGFDRYAWRAVRFDTPHAALSTFVFGQQGPAAVGYPGALLVSERRREGVGRPHSVAACVQFVPNERWSSQSGGEQENGIAIYLTHSIMDIGSVDVQDGIKVVISSTGFISITDQDFYTSRSESLRRYSAPAGHPIFFTESRPNYLPQTASQLRPSDAYAFRVTDHGTGVTVEAAATGRCDWQYETLAEKLRRKRLPSDADVRWERALHMDTPPGVTQRRVVVRKSGDARVDAVLFRLRHTSGARCRTTISRSLGATALLVVLWRFVSL